MSPYHERLANRMIVAFVLVTTSFLAARMAWGQIYPVREGGRPSLFARPMEGREARLVALRLARVVHLEATWRRTDAAAIYWIAVKRARLRDTDWLTELRAYSVLDKQLTPRAREIARYPWGDVPGKTSAFNRRWAELRAYAVKLIAGEVPDPCPDAMDWGGPMDAPRGRQVPAKCAAETVNRMYAWRER